MKHKKGGVLIALGTLLLAGALVLTLYNLWDGYRAAQSADRVVQQLRLQTPQGIQKEDGTVPDYVAAPGMEMPVVRIGGQDYIGTLSLPDLDLSFPIISRWSYAALRSAPCRYTGSAYTNDLVIAAHNYSRHFGRLKALQIGDRVIFTDFDGNVFTYTVAAKEVLPPTAVEEMTGSGWDLTLFTCTVGGAARVTVRCQLAE